ncbi:Similar to hypothetical protein [Tuber melanosporum Mel28]; acc. no. XP_002839888 [Pyronema omphalodes CBS 100304]|uniref:Inositolphosphotransferase Aur1/Ipt1 domain-containing protein n=1 Tax=Pyronema omphalodes (strain CBS 100304) TaxID=1076935 RepID=U4LD34_PYROM|nr:Similar to hypothetical protein [Tuber melanosporum Mel28]; acc. no. XP_002839888 [Pyronema omphalodes CBS 100304]
MALPPTTTTIQVPPLSSAPPEWNSDPAWKLPSWAEPIIVASILFGACYCTRRRNFSILNKSSNNNYTPLSLHDDDTSVVEPYSDTDSSSDYSLSTSTLKHPPRRRRWLWLTITTPNTSRFANNPHSRILHKFPFLLEMFYWILTYFLYRLTHILSQSLFSDSIWDTAQENALKILFVEQFSFLSFAFPVQEISVQKWFLAGHPLLLTVLNKAYALIHIPGTVFFMAWYYSAAPNHAVFAVVRRTMTLCNLLAFTIFMLYPCMPPRLLPKEFGFVDTVRRDSAESVFMNGKFVNHLAAMPSMHFGYSFIIGMTCLYHAGGFRWMGVGYQNYSGLGWRVALGVFGVAYPLGVLTVIVATANHYWLDAVAAAGTAAVALVGNRVFVVLVPLEDCLLWVLRVERPRHTTGEKEGGRD